jgi:hypothetical protein
VNFRFTMRLVCALALLLATALAASGEIVFQGVISAGEVQQFALQDVTGGESRWCKPGETFGTLTLVRYDEAREVLICRSASGQPFELPLRVSRVRALVPTGPARRYAQVFLSDVVRESLRAKGESDADVYEKTLASLRAELARRPLLQDRAEIQRLIDGFKAGLVKIYCTEGKPLRYEDAPELKREAVDRINQLQKMSLAEVDALIAKRKAEAAAAQSNRR